MATQKVYCSYQEIIDLHTEQNKVTALGIHTPTGKTPHKMFPGFFEQFKRFAYLGCSISLVPAATLPVDPLQVSYDNPNQAMDPRDVLNPILFHGCHGQDMGAILNNLYTAGYGVNPGFKFVDQYTDATDRMDFPNTVDVDLMEKLYYKALTDNTWKKAHPQRGFRKAGLRPLIYRVNATQQIMPTDPDEITSLDFLEGMGTPTLDYDNPTVTPPNPGAYGTIKLRHEPAGLQFVANKLTGLGWMDTRTIIQSTSASKVLPNPSTGSYADAIAEVLETSIKETELPRLYMAVILFSPSYEVIQHYRLIINHRWAFAKFRGVSFDLSSVGINEDSPSNFTGDDDDNGFGSGDDDDGGDSEPTMSLSGAVTLGFTPVEGADVALYSKLTIEGDEYTVTGSQQFGSYTCGFVLHDGKVYLGGKNSSGLVYITSSSTGMLVNASTNGSTSITPNGLTLSPTDADLYADLVDGGIEYDGE